MGTFAVRRLGVGDEAVVRILAEEDDDFDLAERSSPRTPLGADDAAAYLADPSVLHWVVEKDGRVIGHLLCYVERRRVDDPRQLLLYEVGVRRADRRRGVGRALVDAMRSWMRQEGVVEAWVVADPEAEAFYTACGFRREEEQTVQLTLTVS